VVFRAAFKPTPSIAREQQSVNMATGEDVSLVIHGRHDPCIVPRALPCVEAAAAVAIYDAILESGR
jgi:chorismate synthase